MITEKYVSFETANLLKEKDFPQDPYMCNTVYTSRGKFSNNAKSFCHNVALFNQCGVKPVSYSMAPTLQMAMDWLRVEHNLFIQPTVGETDGKTWYDFDIIPVNGRVIYWKSVENLPETVECDSPEEACEIAIKYCLENLIK